MLQSQPLGSCKHSIYHELGSKLSSGARIITSESSRFSNINSPLARVISPRISGVVEVATEQDIQEVIRYANAHDVPFLATTGKHGDMTTLAGLKVGIKIELRALEADERQPRV